MKDLNPLFLNQLRLGVVSLLANVESAEFGWIKEQTGATAGNLSIQIKKLTAAGYVLVEKSFRNNYPLTTCTLTKEGHKALTEYVEALRTYLKI